MDKLVTTKSFPDPKEGESLKEYMPRLLRWIEKELWFNLVTRINFLLDRSNDDFLEIVKDGNVAGDDDNWRIVIVNDDIQLEHREGGSWVLRGFLYRGA